jgi:hypothetical protein
LYHFISFHLIYHFSYYGGTVHAGEFVQLHREPHNPHDRYAVRVDSLRGAKVGHIKRQQAAILAKLMDDVTLPLHMEAVIPRPGTFYTLPVTLQFYAVSPATDDAAQAYVSQAVASQLEGAFQHQYNYREAPGFSTPTITDTAATVPPAVVQTTQTQTTLNWQTQAQELDDMFDKQTKEPVWDCRSVQVLQSHKPSCKNIAPILLV